MYFGHKALKKAFFVPLLFILLGLSIAFYSLVPGKIGLGFQIGFLFLLCLTLIKFGNFKFGLFSPLPLTLLFLLFSFSITPLLYLFQDSVAGNLITLFLPEKAYIKTMVCVLLFTSFIIFGYHLHFGYRIGRALPALPLKWSSRLIKLVVPLLIIIGLTIYLALVYITGMSISEIYTHVFLFRYKLLKLSGGLYHLRNLSYLCLWSGIWIFLIYFFTENKKLTLFRKLYITIAFTFLVVLSLTFGQRILFFLPILSLFATLHFTGRRVRIYWYILAGISLPIFSFAYISYRNMSFSGADFTLLIDELLNTSLFDYFSQGLLLSLDRFFPLSIVLSSYPPLDYDFLFGKTFFYLFTIPLPMSLFPERPVYTDAFLTSLFFPSTGSLSAGLAFTAIAEFYINFHILGIIFGGFLFGLLLRISETYLSAHDRNPSIILCYVNGSVNAMFFPISWLTSSLYSPGTVEFIFAILLNILICFSISDYLFRK